MAGFLTIQIAGCFFVFIEGVMLMQQILKPSDYVSLINTVATIASMLKTEAGLHLYSSIEESFKRFFFRLHLVYTL